MFELDSDKEVHKFLGNTPVNSIEEARKNIALIRQQYIDNGIERWARLVYDFLKLSSSPVIVVDTFSGDMINKYLDSLYQFDRGLVIKIFSLFTTDDELRKRLELRSNGEFRDFGISKLLNDDVIKIKYDTEFQIDTTALLPNQTAAIIYGRLNDK